MTLWRLRRLVASALLAVSMDELHLVALQSCAKLLGLPTLGKKGALGSVRIGAVEGILLLFADQLLIINAIEPFETHRAIPPLVAINND